jgi:hypothetical protein
MKKVCCAQYTNLLQEKHHILPHQVHILYNWLHSCNNKRSLLNGNSLLNTLTRSTYLDTPHVEPFQTEGKCDALNCIIISHLIISWLCSSLSLYPLQDSLSSLSLTFTRLLSVSGPLPIWFPLAPWCLCCGSHVSHRQTAILAHVHYNNLSVICKLNV